MLRSGNIADRRAEFAQKSRRKERGTRSGAVIEHLEDRRLLSAGTLIGTTQSVPFTVGPMAADPGRDIVYIADNSDQEIIAVNTDTGTTANIINVAANVTGLAISPDDSRLYVAEATADAIQVFSASTGSPIKTLAVGLQVDQLAAIANDRVVALADGGIQFYDVSGDLPVLLYSLQADSGAEIKSSLDGGTLWQRGESAGINRVLQWDVLGNGPPVPLSPIPAPFSNPTDFAVDPTQRRAYMSDGGIYGITEVNIASGVQTFWPYVIGPYSYSVGEYPGSPYVYGLSYGDLEQFNQSGTVLNTYSFKPTGTQQSLVVTPNGNLMFAAGDEVSIIGVSNLSIYETLPGPPVISRDPFSQTVILGNQASFSAFATGFPVPTVQWQVSTDGTNFTNISGARSSNYNFIAALSENGNYYRAVFTNSYGSVATAAAKLTVAQAPVITMEPVNQKVAPGQSVTLTAAASGTPTPTAQWQISTNGNNFGNIFGATSSTYTFTATALQNGEQFRVVFTNSAGTATSNAATLTIDFTPTAPAITTQPTDQTVQDGQNATFTVAASGYPIPSVQWQVSSDGTTFTDIFGATLMSYTFAASANQNGNEFRAVVTNSQGSATSNPAKLTTGAVNAPPPPFVAAFGALQLPVEAVIGGTLKGKILVSITNTGGQTLSGSFTFDLFADPSTSFGGGQLLTHFTKRLSLRSGQSKVVNISLRSIPAGLTAGLDYPALQITDTQGDSTIATSTQVFQLAQPVVALAVVPGAVTPPSGSDSRSITVAVTNTGNVSTSGQLVLTLSPSSDGTSPVTGVTFAHIKKNVRLRADQTLSIRLHFKVTATTPTRTYLPYMAATLGSVTQTTVGGAAFTI